MTAPFSLSFFAHGDPKGQPRPRAFARGGKARVFDPGTAEGWKSAVAVAAHPVLVGNKFDGPLSVEIRCYFRRPKGHSTKRGLRPNAPLWMTSKPDGDNIAKAVLDALTSLGAWADDAQVACLVVEKLYTTLDQPVGARIRISEIKAEAA